MIQINLIPDVKQELLRAQKQRLLVISISVFASLAAIALVIVLAMYVFGVQTIRSAISDNNIKDESTKLSQIEDLSNTLTIQNQLDKLSNMHSEKQMTSRLFDILATIDPPAPNNMTISNVSLQTETNTVSIEGYAVGGFSAVETFKKTIEATTVEVGGGDNAQSLDLAENVNIEETSYGENSEGTRVLRFMINFSYHEDVLSYDATSIRIVAPTRENATDSYRRLPQSLFGQQAEDVQGGN